MIPDPKTIIRTVTENIARIRRDFGVNGLCVFGSVARGDCKEVSDVDMLVDMPPELIKICQLKDYLERILHIPVDLIRRHSHLSPKFLNQINKDAIIIF